MAKLIMPAFLVMILSGVPLLAQEAQRPVDHGSVEQVPHSPEEDYARREQDAGHLEAFRGGAAGGSGLEILVLPIVVMAGLMKLLVSAIGGR
jgi:hypothetical protein